MWILGGTVLVLICAALAVAVLAVRAVKNAGFSFRFDPARRMLVPTGAGGGEVKTPATADGGHPLGPAAQEVLAAWLAKNPDYRAAVDADCACDELLRLNPGKHPYTEAGDFNRDGKDDFAAAAIDRKTGKFALLIFNGPIGGLPGQPALLLRDLDLRRQGLFFGLTSDEPPSLYYGYYNSDVLWRFVPKDNTYVVESVQSGEPLAETSATLSDSAAEPWRLEERHVDRKIPGCGNEKDGCAHAEFTYVEATGGPAAARERINAAIVAACLPTAGGANGKLTPEEAAQHFIDDYASARKEMPLDERTWMLTKRARVLRNAAPIFGVECSEYSFTGGAHGLSGTSYLNLDPATGEPIKLASVLKDGAMARLTEIAEVHFRQGRKLSATGKLADAGFQFSGGRFALNDNYGFGETALLFYYQHYEISYYAMGSTLVEIPYAEIRDLIRPEFPL
jgi:hypothetical protein